MEYNGLGRGRKRKREKRAYFTILKRIEKVIIENNGEFDPGSGRTLAACLTHASQGESYLRMVSILADG